MSLSTILKKPCNVTLKNFDTDRLAQLRNYFIFNRPSLCGSFVLNILRVTTFLHPKMSSIKPVHFWDFNSDQTTISYFLFHGTSLSLQYEMWRSPIEFSEQGNFFEVYLGTMLPSMNLPHNSAIHSSFIDYVWGINTTIIHKNIARFRKQAFS